MSKTTTRKPKPQITDEIKAFMSRFIAFPDERQADALALYVLHTHAFDAAYCTPYIYISSPEKQSGKTRVLEVLHLLCRNPLKTASASPGALYATIESGLPVHTEEGVSYGGGKPTIFLDEVDTIFTGAANEDLRGMLNEGYKRGGQVLRQAMVEGGQRVGVYYSVFCPKVLAGIDNGAMPDTIEDRCIRITLKRKQAGQEVERFMLRKIADEAEALRVKCHNWGVQHMDKLLDAEPKLIEEISDRAFEIAEPLLAIADQIPGWHDRARKALTFLLSKPVAESPATRVLRAARDWFDQSGADKIPSAVLADLCGMNGKRLGGLLDPYGIKPGTRRVDGVQMKAYYRSDFEDAWTRYI